MQDSVSSFQKQPKPINNFQIDSPQSLALDRIPQKGFHRTTWNHIMEWKQEGDKKDEESKENEYEIVNERRWIKNQKILRLHNWKSIQACVSVPLDLNPVKAMLFFREQNHFKMKKLIVCFRGQKIFDVRRFGFILFCLTHRQTEIQDLSLKIQWFENFTEAGVNIIRRTILKNLPNLKSLEWQRFVALSKDAKIIASQMIKGMTRLESLFFNFGMIKLQDNETLPCIARDIARNVPNLEKVILYFWGIPVVPKEEFRQFAEQLCRNLTSLKHLHLNFRRCKSLGPVSLKVLSKEICENLVNLKVLILIFDGCPEITTPDLDMVKTELSQNLPNLKYLSYSDSNDALNLLE